VTKILIIEDNYANLTLVMRVLEPQGYELHTAADAESGIQKAIEELPDLVLIDIGLPDYDGHTVLMWLKQVTELAHTHFVALSAWPAELAAETVDRYGYDGFISKPIDIHQFPTQIRSYLSTAQDV
jgi:two-component system cell cycle response regulator DivK